MSHTDCAVRDCNNNLFNKPRGVTFHPCPIRSDMRNKWLQMLKTKCTVLDWNRSKICSKHFETKCFNIKGKLKDDAVPTLFSAVAHRNPVKQTQETSISSRTNVDRVLNKLTQAELMSNIKNTLSKMKEPSNLETYLNDDYKCKPDTPTEAQLWILIKKQDHLNTRLMELVVQNKKHVEFLQKNLEEAKSSKKETEQSIETQKYIVKCLQEKLATLEEQIDILTTVESR
ncbi:PREDICTED: THAP domain-containing protein 1 B-like [Papilio polytes]|uniref:THAP domain-containing protein 1 B-like n=1 Tax=Papilio polytes TaxID=76194 RepID=UPI0006760D53|nr:PREDICTED: THAP domain-containing protein 1 B-like [Papilio polytes]